MKTAEGSISKRQVFYYWLLLAVLSAPAAWLSVFIHEALGHCLLSQLFGCTPYGFCVGTLFNGYVGAAATPPAPDQMFNLQTFVLKLGGIFAEIIAGVVAAQWMAGITVSKKSPRPTTARSTAVASATPEASTA